MNDFLTMSGMSLAKGIRDGLFSSEQVVTEHINHIQKVNPAINAVVQERFELARKEARQADERVRKEPPESLPVFHGVPCTIKENFALAGMPNTAGLLTRKDVVAKEDATAVKRLRAAGAIPMGVTNIPELCMWMETSNRIYGCTNNPYNPKRIVGGSSGGEGAIIGSGASPFGLGADIGGSIRMPAFFNGVFGHKPSGGLVPGTGQYPFTVVNEALRYLATGPLARRAEDLWPLVKLMAGPDGMDAGCEPMELGDPAQVDLSSLTVIVVDGNGAVTVKEDMKQALYAAAKALEKNGATVKQEKIEALKHSMDIWSAMLSATGGPTFAELLGEGKAINPFLEFTKWALGFSRHTIPAIALAALENAPKKFTKRTNKFIQMGKELKKQLTEMIGPQGVMLYPSYSRVAPPHFVPLALPFHFAYTAILNVMEIPVTQVPAGLNEQGLPLGLQVASIRGNDHVTIAVANHLEKELGGWVMPSFEYLR